MRIENATSVLEGFTKALEIIKDWSTARDPAYCWFRGVKDRKLGLEPGAVWRNKDTGYNELEAFVSFVQEGVAFADTKGIDSWETYYLAQHHGLPTRLLDWTESFMSAMFFALDGAERGKTPCVWILRPAEINGVSVKWKGIMAPENSEALKIWLPRAIGKRMTVSHEGYDYDNIHPISIYAKKSNRRITAQSGAFTLHGKDIRPLQEIILEDYPKPDKVLARIDFPRIKLKDFRLHLELLGVRRSAIYPDLDNLVRQLKDYYC